MAKPKGTNIAKKLFLSGDIKSLADLLEIVEKTPLARSIGTSPARLNKLLANPALFTFQDLYSIADLIGVDRKLLVDLLFIESNKPTKKKK